MQHLKGKKHKPKFEFRTLYIPLPHLQYRKRHLDADMGWVEKDLAYYYANTAWAWFSPAPPEFGRQRNSQEQSQAKQHGVKVKEIYVN